MKYGFVLPGGDARTAADFARYAEDAGWDGFFVWEPVTFEKLSQIRDYVRQHRPDDSPYDIVTEGTTPGEDRSGNIERMRRWEEAGATWWIEALWEAPSQEEVLRRVHRGSKNTAASAD
jgi:hypothetical protein